MCVCVDVLQTAIHLEKDVSLKGSQCLGALKPKLFISDHRDYAFQRIETVDGGFLALTVYQENTRRCQLNYRFFGALNYGSKGETSLERMLSFHLDALRNQLHQCICSPIQKSSCFCPFDSIFMRNVQRLQRSTQTVFQHIQLCLVVGGPVAFESEWLVHAS